MYTDEEYERSIEQLDEINRDFLKLTVSDLAQTISKDRDFLGATKDLIIDLEGLSDKKVDNMSIQELIVLMDNTYDNPTYYYEPMDENNPIIDDSKSSYLSECNMYVRMLDYLEKNNYTVRLFLSQKMSELYDFLQREATDEKQGKMVEDEFALVREMCRHYLGLKESGFTLRDVIWKVLSVQSEPWKPPYKRLGEYADRIMESYKLESRIFISSYKLAYPKKFNAKRVLAKYKL